ncbi:Predicted arabinose efflux permease, MFS family [Halorientalis persicus]|uniref:Predicted arabinose efflux permease, MFS family n=1 Tax=Halorientalis persicus TaxID=1367881 RepID=A0A1H8Q0X3_9EURY|nr:MFS transporter [Halorientalis persicus]SEO47638.1 Predicted arabinose efflux permease, MFS family [Halorientalis persicus]
MSSRRQFYPLYLTRFVGSLGFITLLTLLPTYIEQLGATGVVVGLFVTALSLGRAIAIVPIGWAADRYSKRTILLVSLALSVLAYASFTVVETPAGFIVARTLQGLSIVGTGMISLALVGDIAGPDERANQIGKYNAWRMAAGVVGTLGAGALYDAFGFDPIFAALVALFVLATLGVWVFVEADETQVEGFAFFDLALNERILTITSFRAQYAVSVTLVRNWVPIFVGVSVARGGLALSAAAVGVAVAAEKFTNMLCQPISGRWSDRFGRGLFITLGGGAYGLIALAIPLAPAFGTRLGFSAAVPILGTVPAVFFVVVGLNGLLGVADAVREPASMALFADEGKDNGIASSFGIRGLVWRPGALLAPLLGGYLMDTAGMAWVFVVGGVTALTGVLTFAGIVAMRYGPRELLRW